MKDFEEFSAEMNKHKVTVVRIGKIRMGNELLRFRIMEMREGYAGKFFCGSCGKTLLANDKYIAVDDLSRHCIGCISYIKEE